MTASVSSSLWPRRARAPLVRLGLALLAASAIVAALLSLGAFVIVGMTEPSAEAVWRVTVRSAIALSLLVFGFALTFGIAGIAFLSAIGKRGLLAWSITGAVAGAVAGVLFVAVAMAEFRAIVAVAFAVAGWVILLLIRAFAGVRSSPWEGSNGVTSG